MSGAGGEGATSFAALQAKAEQLGSHGFVMSMIGRAREQGCGMVMDSGKPGSLRLSKAAPAGTVLIMGDQVRF